jgi:hypothetical protein
VSISAIILILSKQKLKELLPQLEGATLHLLFFLAERIVNALHVIRLLLHAQEKIARAFPKQARAFLNFH